MIGTLKEFSETFLVSIVTSKKMPDTIKKLMKTTTNTSKIPITIVTSDKTDINNAVVLLKFSEFLDMYERRELLKQALTTGECS